MTENDEITILLIGQNPRNKTRMQIQSYVNEDLSNVPPSPEDHDEDHDEDVENTEIADPELDLRINVENEKNVGKNVKNPWEKSVGVLFRYMMQYYMVATVSACIAINVSWATYSKMGSNFVDIVEIFYLYLYSLSILVLFLVALPKVVPRLRYKFFINHLGEPVFIVLAIILLTLSTAYCISEFKAYWYTFGAEKFVLTKLNSALSILLMISEFSLVLFKIGLDTDQLGWRIFFEFGFLHIMTTNLCIWAKSISKEAIVSMLEHHINGTKASRSFYEISLRENGILADTFTIPPYYDACDALETEGKSQGIFNLWTLEEGFSCSLAKDDTPYPHHGSTYSPFYGELVVLLAFVSYDRKVGLEEKPSNNPHRYLVKISGFSLKVSETVFGLVVSLGVVAFYTQDLNDPSDGSMIANLYVDGSQVLISLFLTWICICFCLKMDLSEDLGNLEISLLFITAIGACLVSFCFLLASNGSLLSIFSEVLYLLYDSSLVIFICLLSQRKGGTCSITPIPKIFLENAIILLATHNICIWFRLSFVNYSYFNSSHMRQYWGLTWFVISSITLPLYKFFRFHSGIMLFQAAIMNQYR